LVKGRSGCVTGGWITYRRSRGEHRHRPAGFDIVREAVFEVGDGFVMVDYVMAKRV